MISYKQYIFDIYAKECYVLIHHNTVMYYYKNNRCFSKYLNVDSDSKKITTYNLYCKYCGYCDV